MGWARWLGLSLVVSLAVSGCGGVAAERDPIPQSVPGAVFGDHPATAHAAVVPEGPPAPGPEESLPPPAEPPPTAITVENFAALVQQHHPNELGVVPILEYHHIGDEEERWTRSRENFRGDLQRLYDKGYRAVSLLDYLAGDLRLPAGTSPVIFTFDDSPLSQFGWTEGRPDPNSAVGIMLDFKAAHPDFGAAATFYVNFTPVPFREEENWQEKIRFLVENGFEVANHTVEHEDLSALSDSEVQRALAEQVRRLREVIPDYDGSSMALPFGAWPSDRILAIDGEYGGVRYHHRGILLVGADPAFSPFDRRHDPMALPRIQAIAEEFARWMSFLDQNRYISDGDPTTVVVPAEQAKYLKAEAVRGRSVRTIPAAS